MTGLPGSGKTRLATRVAQSWPGSVIVDSDDPGIQPGPWSCRSTAVVKQALFKAQVSPVIATLLRWELIDLHLSPDQPSALVWLDLPLAECISRQPQAYRGITGPVVVNLYKIPAFTFVPPPQERATRITDPASFAVSGNIFKCTK